jgi:cell division protein FtsW
LLVFAVNEVYNNATRTLRNGSIQPSELAKIAIIIYISVWLISKKERLNEFWFGLFPLGLILGFTSLLILLQPDLSATLTILALGLMMFFLADTDLKQIVVVFFVAILLMGVLVMVNPTGSRRVATFREGLKNPLNADDQIARSFQAFASGGWVGVGLGKSQVKVTHLPVPFTDSIFAVVGEELGVAGAATLVALYALLLWRGLRIANRAPDDLGRLLAMGLSVWIAMEAFINMAVMVGLVPTAGNALPFISYGGSNLMVTWAAIGILMNISRLSHQSQEEGGKAFHAVVDLRRRDRGRSVSRPVGR